MLSLGVLDTVASRLDRGTIATILAIVFFGAGHIYLGQVRRGIAILTIGIGLLLIAYPGFIGVQYMSSSGIDMQTITRSTIVNISLFAVGLGSIGYWVWQIIDARKLATKQQIAEA
ncbi:hypothetical protein Ngar_c04810 [Candidatus Nitrososphaera gargensis Ga9.2]|uniref:TM2 domain-containing protein n=1 Tax=Nitrososphaera gargensis (strain Ga9.2) TaxID=1237085 RepID=K0ICQ7_NITGG|nr:hypothetical protein [Candidatus Nitrososphaera gargensis]AFU57425.1 hypothetical protein Ngar_c04810 [Candidatus Nitrososphaera gargensis Ga9.2]